MESDKLALTRPSLLRRVFLAGLAFATTGAFCGGALAQTRDPVAATALFTRGRAAVEAGDYTTACPLFAESLRLDTKVGTLLNLASCEERIGQLAEALHHWQQAIQLAQATGDRRGNEARRRIDALAPRVPRLTVNLSADAPASTRVLRDDVVLGRPSLGIPLPVNPGDLVIVVRAEGHADRSFPVSFAEGESKTVQVALGPALPKPPPPPPAAPAHNPPAPEPARDNTLAYVLGGVGVAGVITGSVTGLMLLSKHRTIDEQCDEQNQCGPAGLSAVEDARGLAPINTVAWIVGVAGLGAGTMLLVTSGPSPSSVESGTAMRRGGLGLRVAGEF